MTSRRRPWRQTASGRPARVWCADGTRSRGGEPWRSRAGAQATEVPSATDGSLESGTIGPLWTGRPCPPLEPRCACKATLSGAARVDLAPASASGAHRARIPLHQVSLAVSENTHLESHWPLAWVGGPRGVQKKDAGRGLSTSPRVLGTTPVRRAVTCGRTACGSARRQPSNRGPEATASPVPEPRAQAGTTGWHPSGAGCRCRDR